MKKKQVLQGLDIKMMEKRQSLKLGLIIRTVRVYTEIEIYYAVAGC